MNRAILSETITQLVVLKLVQHLKHLINFITKTHHLGVQL